MPLPILGAALGVGVRFAAKKGAQKAAKAVAKKKLKKGAVSRMELKRHGKMLKRTAAKRAKYSGKRATEQMGRAGDKAIRMSRNSW